MATRSVDEPRDRSQPPGGVRLATKADLDAMCSTLVEAFAFDPVASWVYPEVEQRRVCLSEWYELTLRAGLRCGHTYTVADNRAVAIWSPPSVSQMFDWEREGTAIADMLKRQLGERTETVMNGLMSIESAHPRGVPHFYLAMLGTLPAVQGRGLAGALLSEVLGRCDREGWPAYLETSRERNVRFYESRRFEVTGRTSLPDGPPVWFMWRDPEAL